MGNTAIKLTNIHIQFGQNPICTELDFEVQQGQRIGLIGLNGAGKSSLMKVMAGVLKPDAGHILRATRLTWAWLEQSPTLDTGRTVWEEMLTAVPEIIALREDMLSLENQMGEAAVYEHPDRLTAVLAAHEELLVAYERLDGERYESQLKQALQQVGLDERDWDKPTAVLSGGQKKLILLAKLIVRQPDLLLLDEPDNHLDVAAKQHLEKLLSRYSGAIVIVSHDRYLLDEVVTHIAELEKGQVTLYPGNYTDYTAERELRRLRQQKMYAAQQKEIAAIEAAIARYEHWAVIANSEKHARKARSRYKMLERMDKVDKVTESRRMGLDLAGWRGSNKAIILEEVAYTLPNGHLLWQNLNATIWHGERVGLVGANGVGKSMLLRHILDHENVSHGRVKIGPSCVPGYYAQEQETLNVNNSPMQELRLTAPLSEEAAMAMLHKFLFTYEQARGRIHELSGGEQSRLQLAKLVLCKPNLLLLDEPTNNLDISAIEILEETLENFVGTVLVISHDRYFLDRVVDRIIELQDDGLREFSGGYTDYLLTC